MDQLYFVIHDIKRLPDIVKTLTKSGIAANSLQIFAGNSDHPELNQLLEGSLFTTSDLAYALIRGALIGGIMGLVIGVFVLKFSREFVDLETRIVFGLGLFGMIFGAWASSLIGVSVPNPSLEIFEEALDSGEVILFLKVNPSNKNRVLNQLRLNYPDITVNEINNLAFSHS